MLTAKRDILCDAGFCRAGTLQGRLAPAMKKGVEVSGTVSSRRFARSILQVTIG